MELLTTIQRDRLLKADFKRVCTGTAYARLHKPDGDFAFYCVAACMLGKDFQVFGFEAADSFEVLSIRSVKLATLEEMGLRRDIHFLPIRLSQLHEQLTAFDITDLRPE